MAAPLGTMRTLPSESIKIAHCAGNLAALFAIETESCLQCSGRLWVIASIQTPAVINRILEHFRLDAESVDPAHQSRAPPSWDRLI